MSAGSEKKLFSKWEILFESAELLRLLALRRRTPSAKPHGAAITANQERIFFLIIKHRGESVSVKYLAKQLDITTAAVSQSIERLAKLGLVERRQDPSDRRAVSLTVSEKAISILKEMDGHFCDVLDDIITKGGFTEDEIASFVRTGERLHAQLLSRWGAQLGA